VILHGQGFGGGAGGEIFDLKFADCAVITAILSVAQKISNLLFGYQRPIDEKLMPSAFRLISAELPSAS
jgi:hypothetical protein